MAGLGKKTFLAGEVLTASDVNGYLMDQSVMVFGGTAARSSAIPTPSEGMVTYRTDANAIEYYDGSTWNAVGVSLGLFYKTDFNSVAFTKTGAGTAQIKAGTTIDVNGATVKFTTATSITMPTLTTGTDYFIYVSNTGTIQAVAATGTWPTPVASPPANSVLIGGFHYAPGGNATGTSGGDTTPAINEYSMWDLKFRPDALDPRGMTLVANRFWSDIYLMNRDPQTNGTSKYNVTIADGETGSTTAIIPTMFGGNGSTRYTGQTWWNTAECLSAFGKRLPKYDEFQNLAYGTTEASSVGSDQVSTILNAAYTSKWGVIQSTGVMYTWGSDFGGPYGSAAWTANTGGRGSTYNLSNAVILGGYWAEGANSGSRCSGWNGAPTVSGGGVGGRGVCDHLKLV